ncbi:MAG: hypothetical protein ACTSR7_04400 [Promethearchaeota archaeon]
MKSSTEIYAPLGLYLLKSRILGVLLTLCDWTDEVVFVLVDRELDAGVVLDRGLVVVVRVLLVVVVGV